MAIQVTMSPVQKYLTGTIPVTNQPLTIVSWVYVTAAENNRGVIGIFRSPGSQSAGLAIDAGMVVRAGVYDGSSWAEARTTATFSTNTWIHAGGVFLSNTSRTAYLNGGNAVTNTTNRVIYDMHVIHYGRNQMMTNGPIEGYVAEQAVWNVALSSEEMAILATGMSPLFIRPAALVAYAPLIRTAHDYKNGVLTPVNDPQTVPHLRIIYPRPKAVSIPMLGGIAHVVQQMRMLQGLAA